MASAFKIAPSVEELPYSNVEVARFKRAASDFDVPSSEEWAGIMKRARNAKGLTQQMLADATGTTQNTVSELENYKLKASKAIPSIAMALGIPLPIIFIKDDFDQRWVDVGRALRAKSMKRFLNYLANFEEECGITPPEDSQSDRVESSADEQPGRRPANGAGSNKAG